MTTDLPPGAVDLLFAVWAASAVKGGVVLGATAVLATVLRRRSAAARHLVWALGLGALAALPVLGTAPPRWTVRVSAPASVARWIGTPSRHPAARARHAPRLERRALLAGDAPAVTPARYVPGHGAEAPAAPAQQRSTHGTGAQPVPDWPWRPLVVFAWLGGAGLVLAATLRSCWRLAGLARRARHADDFRVRPLADRLARALDVGRPVRLLMTEEDMGPVTWGVIRPTVLLPAAALGWPGRQLEAVLLHELAHVQRRDLLVQLVAVCACAAHWYNPLVWLAAGRLAREREHACDDAVLWAGHRPSEYAGVLVTLARAVRGRPQPAAVAAVGPGELTARVRAVLAPRSHRGAVSATQRRAAVLATVGLLVPLAAARSGRASPPAARHAPDRAPDRASDRTARRAAGGTREGTGEGTRLVTRAGTPDVGPGKRVGRVPAAPLETAATARADQRAALRSGRPAPGAVDGWADLPPAAPGRPAGAFAVLAPPSAASAVRIAGGSRAAADSGAAATGAAAQPAGVPAAVRRRVVWALHGGGPGAVDLLARALRGDPDAGVREMATWSLASVRDARAADALGDAVARDADAEVRFGAWWALEQHGTRAAAAALGTALRDPSPALRRRAAWYAGAEGVRARVPDLAAALADADAGTRRAAAWSLGNLRARGRAAALRPLLRDADPGVREAALWALHRAGDAEARAAMAEVRAHGAAGLRALAANALDDGPWPWPWPSPLPRPRPTPD